jgi:RHS repeat-associated protein
MKEGVMAAIWRRYFYFVILLSLISVITSEAYAADRIIFGPTECTIARWHFHLSFHRFKTENPGDGLLTITKNNPDKKIRGGFLVVNRTFIRLSGFLRTNGLSLEKTIHLRAKNRLVVFLRGTPGASITVQVRAKAPLQPPKVVFSAEPPEIKQGDSTTLAWTTADADSVSIDQGIGSVDLSGSRSVSPQQTTTYVLTATGVGGTTTESVTVTVYLLPTVTIAADPEMIVAGESSTLTWSSTSAESCFLEPGIGSVAPNGSVQISPTETTTFSITATGLGGMAMDSITITVNDPSSPPTVDIRATPSRIVKGGSSTLSWVSSNGYSAYIDNGIGIVPLEGSAEVSPEYTTTFTICVTGPTGSASMQAVLEVIGNPALQPKGSFGEHYEDLIPVDATVERYDPKRFSLITGLVQGLDGSGISDVFITIQGCPEYGTCFTDNNGRFSIPVEGGTTMTLVYQRDGLIPAQRKVYVPWNDIAIAKTINMIPEDPVSTTITFDGNPETIVTHQSSEVTDEFGTRSCTMVFTGDNRAYLADKEGNKIHKLTTIATRATEYTTPESMPAILPPTSAYTYCVELSVDGVQRVKFEKPISIWVDNFLRFDVGEIVPVGYYDRDRGVWIPSDNGVVVKLLDTDSDSIVDALDENGDNLPDDLDGDGAYRDEIEGLNDPLRYLPETTFWRIAMRHFSPCDCNWPSGPSQDAISPNAEGLPDVDQKKDEQRECLGHHGSFVEERGRILHEDIPIPGSRDMRLHYASNRVKGYRTLITVPASGEVVPESLEGIIVEVTIAGRKFEQILDPLPNQRAEFVWDGLDHLGRPITFPVTAHVTIGFEYDGIYYVPDFYALRAFGQPGESLTDVRTRNRVVKSKHTNIAVDRTSNADQVIAAGWSLSTHHSISPMDQATLHKGDGTITRNRALIIETAAGKGKVSDIDIGDGGLATSAYLREPKGIAFDSSGNLYIADHFHHCIRKVDTNGVITTVAGNGNAGYSGDNGPATKAQLYRPFDIAVDSNGNLYIADGGTSEAGNNVIRKVDKKGIITTVAGAVYNGYQGDGCPATEVYLVYPRGIAIDKDANIYIAEQGNHVIRKVDTSGIIETIVGTGIRGYSGDLGPAVDAQLNHPTGLAVDAGGSFFIADTSNNRIRKVDTTGIITTVAGNGSSGYSGDLGPAVDAQLNHPTGLAVDAGGNLYFADTENNVIRKVDIDGIICTVAGIGDRGYNGDGISATAAQLASPHGIAIDGEGDLFIGDTKNNRIRKVSSSPALDALKNIGGIIFVEDGLVYGLTTSGLHKNTVDLDSGVTLYGFGYNENKSLISITDRFGNEATIERYGNGVPISITSHDGLTTTLTVDANNYLTRITRPDGAYFTFEYTQDGLMRAKIEPEGNRFEYVFDSAGRLTDVTDQEGGHWQYFRTVFGNGDILIKTLTGERNRTTYFDHTESTGAYTSTITDPTSAETLFTQSADGLTVNKTLPCGMKLKFSYDLDPEYQFRYPSEMKESTPFGLQKVTLRDKTYADTDMDDIPDVITEKVTVNGNTTILENDIFQSQRTITSPQGRQVTTLYDPDTLLTTSLIIPGIYKTNYGYDSKGRPISISKGSRETDFWYNEQGFLESIVDPMNYATSYTYDPIGRMTGISQPDGTFIGFTYDKNGNMTVVTTPSTIDHRFGFNSVNLNDYYQTPLSGSYQYLYDKDRRLIQTTFPSGNKINNIYDNSLLIQIQTPEGNIDFTYLCGTKVGSITNGTDTITYGYDGSLLLSETMTGSLNQTLGYTYNNDFNLSSFTYAGDTHLYAYDEDGLLTGAGGFTIFRNKSNGLPQSITGGDLKLFRTFNGYGEVDGQEFVINGLSRNSWNLARDDNGRIIQRTETVDGTTSQYEYDYDSMGRLLKVKKDGDLVEEYEYSPNGTRTYEMNSLRGIIGRTFAYSDEDHLLTAGNTTYVYNVDGFLTSKTHGSDSTTYNYCYRGELLNVTLPDGTFIEYIHDPLGRRIAKKIKGTIIKKYLWQGLTRLLAVYNGNDTLLMRFEYADGRMPVSVTKGGSIYYLAYDLVGSLRIVSDAAGNVVKRIDYDSFGNIINDTNPSFSIPFGFAGGLHDRDTNFVRFGFRDYDPDIGRWTAKDPIGFVSGSVDLYGYCLGDPINYFDSVGLLEISDLVSVGVAIMATTAKVGGLISVGLAQTIGGVVTIGTILIPSELADEDQILEEYRTMQEINEINRRIEDIQNQLEPILDLLNIEYDWDDDNSCS